MNIIVYEALYMNGTKLYTEVGQLTITIHEGTSYSGFFIGYLSSITTSL
jgi:hypothetical protein